MNINFSTNDFLLPKEATTELSEMKNVLQSLLAKAKGLLGVDHCLHPILYTFSDEGVTPYEVEFDTEKAKEATTAHMKELAQNPGVRGMALLLDTYARFIPSEDALQKSIKGMEGTYTAITCILHTPEDSSIRQLPYEYSEEKNQYWFSDSDWQDSKPVPNGDGDVMPTRFENPWISLKK